MIRFRAGILSGASDNRIPWDVGIPTALCKDLSAFTILRNFARRHKAAIRNKLSLMGGT
jgi:hypothetical protein